MHLANPEGIHFCFVGERAIFADTHRELYTATEPETAAALKRALGGSSILGMDERLLEPLLNEGLLYVTDDPARSLMETSILPASGEWPALPPAGAILTVRGFWAQLKAALDLKRAGFSATIASRNARLGRPLRGVSAEEIVAAFRMTNLLFSAEQRCLIKSVGLFEMLKRAGHEPVLVAGVRDDPFGAHAWVEVRGAVVSDFAESIARYTPIFVRR